MSVTTRDNDFGSCRSFEENSKFTNFKGGYHTNFGF